MADFNPNLTSTMYYKDPDTGNYEVMQTLYGSENRVWVDLSEIPKNLQNAAVAIEDKRFYDHNGVDWVRTAKAILLMFTGGDIQGGSTITQQLIKQLLLTSERSYTRKMKEAILGLPPGKGSLQGRDPDHLPESDLPGRARLRRGSRRAHLFRQARFGHHPGRKRGHRRSAQGPQQLQSLSPSRGRQGPPDVRAGPPARPEMDHPQESNRPRPSPWSTGACPKARAGPPSGIWRRPAACCTAACP